MENQVNRENYFFFIYTLVLLFIVLLGFAPSLFLRFAFETPPIPLYLHLHGVILTGWFIWLVAQAWLIRIKKPILHRKLGYFGAIYGLAVLMGGLMASLNSVSRGLGIGATLDTNMADINPAMGAGITYLVFISDVVWANIIAVSTFAILLCSAVIFRTQSEVHKRLILIATVSILEPALARISRIEILGGEQGPFIHSALLMLLAAIIIYDLVTLKKVHKATLVAIIFVITLNRLGSMIAGSEFGLEFIRSLA